LIEDGKGQLLAFPTMGGSGSITSFSLSDGFIEIPEDTLFLEEGELAKVHLFRQEWSPPDLSVIGSHCIGIDLIIRIIMKGKPGYRAKVINVGSIGGLQSVKRGEADVAGIHLLDEETGEYNLPYFRKLDLKGVSLVKGYRREQGFILPKGNPRNFRGFKDLISGKLRFINRNRGSGTRILLDYHLRKLSVSMDVKFDDLTSQIKGYKNEAKSHSAVAHAILSGRADVGVATRNIAETLGLEFQKIADEEFDFAIPSSRFNKPGLKLFLEILRSDEFKRSLTKEQPGLVAGDDTGVILS
jgi:putative molybdopterin biosynthesis protein